MTTGGAAAALVGAFVGAASFLLGCDLTVPTAGGADDAATDAAPETVGDQCTSIVTAFCTHAINACAMSGITVADCVNSDMAMCCAGSACTAISQSSVAVLDQCLSAIDTEDCNLVANSTLPDACQGVPQMP